ncbi:MULTISPECIES: DUF4189 domain-containing protein [Xanthomonas]|uniref:DUF4189 domain-containing protein n=1 Tax=Xanthomonas TaxID=338 RepID=UPI000E1E497A|nr:MULTISPECIES: DUF4189 domain-containing protein [Xanthomonas]
MKIAFSLIFFISAYFMGFPLLAEGNCPPGSYPIGGQGAVGCAPINNQGASATPQPTGEWETRWGVLAKDKSTQTLGVTAGEKSKSAARRTALDNCSKGGGKDCKAIFVYKNACVAVVDSESANSSSIISAPDSKQALQMATSRCAASGALDCKLFYTACSDPHFRAY